MTIDRGELWVVEPPAPPEEFSDALAYFIYSGLDLAFGPGDTLPAEPPDSLEGITTILVWIEDLGRIKGKLRGFRDFDADAEDPLNYDRDSYIQVADPTKVERRRAWWVQMYLHENNRTWLAVYGSKALGFPNRLESPLILEGSLTLRSPRFRARMLARDDQWIHDRMMDGIRASNRTDWGDIPYNLGKALLDDYDVTGDRRSLDRVVALYSTMQANVPRNWTTHTVAPVSQMVRLAALTGDDTYAAQAGAALDVLLRSPSFKEGPAAGWSHAAQAFSQATYEYLTADRGDMGSYGEQMACAYFSAMAASRAVGREDEIADRVATAVKALRDHLRDPETGLYWHGLAARREGHRGFMGHGTGWSAYGLAQILEVFPRDHAAFDDLVRIFNELCEAAIRVQDPEDGCFHSILNWPDTLMNIHYTAWLGYAFLKGARKGFLPGKFVGHGKRAWEGIKIRCWNGAVISAAAGNPVARQMQYYMTRNNELRFDGFRNGYGSQAIFCLLEVMRLSE